MSNLTPSKQMKRLCNAWSSDIRRSNNIAGKTRKKLEKLLDNMDAEEQKRAIKVISDFIYTGEEEMAYQINKLDDKLAELERELLTVNLCINI